MMIVVVVVAVINNFTIAFFKIEIRGCAILVACLDVGLAGSYRHFSLSLDDDVEQ